MAIAGGALGIGRTFRALTTLDGEAGLPSFTRTVGTFALVAVIRLALALLGAGGTLTQETIVVLRGVRIHALLLVTHSRVTRFTGETFSTEGLFDSFLGDGCESSFGGPKRAGDD